MNNKELDKVKKIFSYSSEYVIIMNYDFEILWHNQNDKYGIINNNNIQQIFKDEKKPLDSKEYFFSVSGVQLPCRIINYPEGELYILQTSCEDIMSFCMGSSGIRHFFSNQAALIRYNVTGISSSIAFIRNALEEKNLDLIDNYFNIIIKKCRIILKAVTNTEELIKYTENSSEPTAIDLTLFLKKFHSICSNILQKQIQINLTAAPNLYIFADPTRFTICMLSLLALSGDTGDSTSECGQIFIDAKRKRNHVSITVSSEPKERIPGESSFSKLEKLYKEDEANPDMFVVHRFCRSNNGSILIANNKRNKGKTYSIKLPYFKDTGPITQIHSDPPPYRSDMFVIYDIFLSEIADII